MTRSHALDNLRTFLTILVLFHHTSLPYGGIGSWAYESNSCSYPSISSLSISTFNVLNQTFFMALFFLISGHFSAIACGKRSRGQFLKEKWKRLGVPTFVYCVLHKGMMNGILALVRDRKSWEVMVKDIWVGFKGTRGVQGPVWYCATLLVFDGMYAVLRPSEFANPERITMKARSHRTMEGKSQEGISTMQVLVALASTSVASFQIRIHYPIGTAFWPLGVNIGYIPQYTLFYIYGIQSAHSNKELHIFLSRRMLSGLAFTSTMIAVLGFLFMDKELGKGGVDLKTMLQLAMGSPTPAAFLYAAWNEFTGATLSLALLHFFTLTFSRDWKILDLKLARYSYPAFLVHAPIIVFLQSLFNSWCAGVVAKTLLLGAVGIAGSWGFGVVLVEVIEGIGWRGYV
jgi:glucan biosynthesis protein C